MRRIKLASKIFRIGGQFIFWITLVSILILGILMVFYNNFPDDIQFTFDRQIIPVTDLVRSARIPIIIAIWATIAVFLRGIWHGKELFRLYEQGKIFYAENIMRIRRIGETLILFAVVKAIASFAITSVLLSEEVKAQPGLIINLTALIIGLLIYVVSWIMDEGRALREEQELTI
ncbi:DUF2975 domain-containing protein [bacterium]|nr:DUF2975 domain-containing protein [bacterium]